jgi:hypothetical protein
MNHFPTSFLNSFISFLKLPSLTFSAILTKKSIGSFDFEIFYATHLKCTILSIKFLTDTPYWTMPERNKPSSSRRKQRGDRKDKKRNERAWFVRLG